MSIVDLMALGKPVHKMYRAGAEAYTRSAKQHEDAANANIERANVEPPEAKGLSYGGEDLKRLAVPGLLSLVFGRPEQKLRNFGSLLEGYHQGKQQRVEQMNQQAMSAHLARQRLLLGRAGMAAKQGAADREQADASSEAADKAEKLFASRDKYRNSPEWHVGEARAKSAVDGTLRRYGYEAGSPVLSGILRESQMLDPAYRNAYVESGLLGLKPERYELPFGLGSFSPTEEQIRGIYRKQWDDLMERHSYRAPDAAVDPGDYALYKWLLPRYSRLK